MAAWLFLSSLTARGQTPTNLVPAAAARPGATQTQPPAAPILNQGGQIIIAPPGASAPPVMDPQMAALMQQAGMDRNVVVTAEFDPPVAVLGQRITYRVVITAMIEGVALPDPLPVVPGLVLTPAGRGFNYGMTGAAMQPRTTMNYRVDATHAGAYVMPSYNASANGRSVRVPEARLTVLPPGTPLAQQPLRLLAEVPDEECYIGQSVPVRLVLVDTGNHQVQALSQPVIRGDAFMAEQALNRQSREVRSVNGRPVQAYLLPMLVIPIKEGRHAFTGQAYAHLLRGPAAPGLGAAMDTVLLDSDPAWLTVKHLPREGELPGFTGAIGVFHVDPPKPSATEIKVGEPLTLSVTVRGEGNLTRLVPPRIERVRDWQAFPALADASGSLQIQLRGAAVFTYTLIPLNDQSRATPAIPFSYFDPRRKTYVDATIPPVPITVLPSPAGAAPVAELARANQGGVDDPDLAPNEREPVMTGLAEQPGTVWSSLRPIHTCGWFLALQAVPAALLSGLWLHDRRRRHFEQHPELVRKAQARRRLRRHQRELRRAAAAQDAAGFVAAAINAFRALSAPVEGANPDALVCADVLRALPVAEREGSEGRLVRQLFAAAEARQFMAGQVDAPSVLALRPGVEALLEKWRSRL